MCHLVPCLVDNVVFSEGLISMLLEAFSNLNKSVGSGDSGAVPPQPLTPPRRARGIAALRVGLSSVSLFKVLARARGAGPGRGGLWARGGSR